VDEQMQWPTRGHPRILLAERAGGAVAGVRERCLAGGDQRRVELLEPLHREEHLAADLDLRRMT
jgi:hypothetical protein